MMIKYGTLVIYKCSKCDKTVEIPLHAVDESMLEKEASGCLHSWEKIEEVVEDEHKDFTDDEENTSI